MSAPRELPPTRPAITHRFQVGGHKGYITVGLYEDGSPGEIFITMAKEGSTLSGLMDALAATASLALQHGTPLYALCRRLCYMRFEPSGPTDDPQLPFAHSVVDYIFRWLALRFLPEEERTALGIRPGQEAERCPACRAPLVRENGRPLCPACGRAGP
jgi:ribonucleoside-diphosphate reductase alpha chain